MGKFTTSFTKSFKFPFGKLKWLFTLKIHGSITVKYELLSRRTIMKNETQIFFKIMRITTIINDCKQYPLRSRFLCMSTTLLARIRFHIHSNSSQWAWTLHWNSSNFYPQNFSRSLIYWMGFWMKFKIKNFLFGDAA